MTDTTIDRAVHGFIRDHASRAPNQLDRTPVVVERGVILRAVHLLSRAAASKSVSQPLQLALVEVGMALINSDRLSGEPMRRPRKAST